MLRDRPPVHVRYNYSDGRTEEPQDVLISAILKTTEFSLKRVDCKLTAALVRMDTLVSQWLNDEEETTY